MAQWRWLLGKTKNARVAESRLVLHMLKFLEAFVGLSQGICNGLAYRTVLDLNRLVATTNICAIEVAVLCVF